MRNLNVKQYSRLKDTTAYDAILKHLKPVNLFAGNKANLDRNTYSEVMSTYKLITKLNNWGDMFELFEVCYKVDIEQFENASIVEYWHSLNYLIGKLTKMQENESKLLQSVDFNAGLWERAGGKRLNPYSVVSPIDTLAEKYGMYPFDLMEKEYKQILILLSLTKIKSEVTAKYEELVIKERK